MKIYQEGDKGKAFCADCSALVSTTFLRRDVPFSDGQGLAKHILVAACDACGQTVAVPAQSTPAISKARKEAAVSIEVSLPAIYLDVLDCAAFTIDHQASTDFRKTLLSFFVHKAAHDARAAKRLRALGNGEYQREGETQSRKFLACVVASTNRDLKQKIRAGHFRAAYDQA